MRRRKLLRTVWRCTWEEWVLLAEACWSLGVARCAVTLLPFRRLAAGLGTPMAESPTTDADAHRTRVAQIGWAVQAISRRLPGTRQCLVQALAATWMLQRRHLPSTLYVGVAKENTGHVTAHAWVRCGTQVLTGGQGQHHFTVVATFAAPPGAATGAGSPSGI